jgi:hypothetical protein
MQSHARADRSRDQHRRQPRLHRDSRPSAARRSSGGTGPGCRGASESCSGHGIANGRIEQVMQDRDRDQHAGAVAQRPARPVDRLTRSTAGQAKRRGDLRVAQPLQLPHDDRRPLRIGQGA